MDHMEDIVVQDKLKVHNPSVHLFSCDKSSEVKEFLSGMFGPSKLGCLFSDACSLVEGEALDVFTDTVVKVGRPTELSCGIPCQDISRENQHKGINRNVVCAGQKRTGKVLHDVLGFIKSLTSAEDNQLRFVILEEPLGLADGKHHKDTNLDHWVRLCKENGIHCLVMVLCPSYFGQKVTSEVSINRKRHIALL